MKLGRCPVCHSNLHLDQLVADDAGRQLLGQFARMNYKLGGAMVAYLALFRPTKQDLSNSKALSLVQETLDLTTNLNALAEALETAVTSLQQSRVNGTGKQLTNHNYLRKILAARLGQIAAETPAGSSIEYKAQSQTNPDEDRRLFEARMRQLGGRVIEASNE